MSTTAIIICVIIMARFVVTTILLSVPSIRMKINWDLYNFLSYVINVILLFIVLDSINNYYYSNGRM
jgi:hypothetical protein